MKMAVALVLSFALLAEPAQALPKWEDLSKATRIGICACLLGTVAVGLWRVSCHSPEVVDRRTEQELKAAQTKKEQLDAVVAEPASRDAKRVSIDGGRTYVVHEGLLYSFEAGGDPRWELPPMNLLAKVQKVVAHGGTVLVLFDDARVRTAQDGNISAHVIAENVTDISAEGPSLFVNVNGQRMRYDAGSLLIDD